MKFDSARVLYLELFFSAILLVINANTALLSFFLLNSIAFFSLAFSVLFLAFVLLYVIKRPPPNANWRRLDGYSMLLHSIFAGMVLFYLLIYLTGEDLSRGLAIQFIYSIETFALFFLMLLPVFFLVFSGSYLIRSGRKKEYRSKLLIFVAALGLLLLYFFVALKGIFIADDEELLKLTSVMMLFNGTNPYAASIAPLLYNNTNTIGATMTTNNTLLGNMDYPALFFLLFIPFYLTAQPTLRNLNSIYLPL